MAKQKKKKSKGVVVKPVPMGSVVPVDIDDEMRDSYLLYSMSVIMSRALPDVRDGLKPVQRRILVVMNDLRLYAGRPYRKCAKISGDVSGNYHPHGPAVIYPTLVRMAQDFNNRLPLVDGQGNFGSVDGDPPAAERYTEARLAPAAMALLSDLEKNTVDFVANYDGSLSEPVVLPANLPNLLINGSQGIAVGMATNMVPHNLGEVIDGIVHLIGHRDATIKDLMKFIPGPDFPTGAQILGRKEIIRAYQTGRGTLTLQAVVDIDEPRPGRHRIIVRELPFQVNKAELVEKIALLVREKKIEGITDLRDESDKDGMRVVIEVRRGDNPEILLNNLLKRTNLRTTIGVMNLAIMNRQPQLFNLKGLLLAFLEHRREVVRRRTKFDLDAAERRAHILEGYKIAIKNLLELVRLIRKSPGAEQARKAIIKKYKLSDIQAKAILDMRLHQLTNLEVKQVDKEYLEVIKKIQKLRSLLASAKKIDDIISEELLEVRKNLATPRRTVLAKEAEDIEVEDLVRDQEVVVSLSHLGYIKRTPLSTYRKQKRGGRGTGAVNRGETDFSEKVLVCNARDKLLLFTSRGRCHLLRAYEIPEAGRYARGKAIVNLLRLRKGESIASLLPISENLDSKQAWLFCATNQGMVKRMELGVFDHVKRGGVTAISLDATEELLGVQLVTSKDQVLLSMSHGQSIRFRVEDVRSMGRSAHGVRGVTLGPNHAVIALTIARRPSDSLLSLCQNGYGKRTKLAEYRLTRRGGKGIHDIKTAGRNGPVVGSVVVGDNDEIIIMTTGGVTIRTAIKEVRSVGRGSSGVRIIRLDSGATVTSVAVVPSEEGS